MYGQVSARACAHWKFSRISPSYRARNLLAAAINNASVETTDATQFDEVAQYDAIAVTGSLPIYDERFQRALKIGGRLFVVVGTAPIMEAWKVTRLGEREWQRESLFETVIEPLVNAARVSAIRFLILEVSTASALMTIPEITPGRIRCPPRARRDLTLLDVREDWELGVASVPNIVHIPMGQVADRVCRARSRKKSSCCAARVAAVSKLPNSCNKTASERSIWRAGSWPGRAIWMQPFRRTEASRQDRRLVSDLAARDGLLNFRVIMFEE